MRIGLALGSGGARGWCHVGVIRGLARMGVEADVVAGASMGALVGGVHAAGRLDALEDWARALTRPSFLRLLDFSLSNGGLVGANGVSEVLSGFGLDGRIEDLALPFAAVSSDLGTGAELVLDKGALIPAIRASIALPGVISPYRLGERWCLDGGLTNPVPVSVCRGLGADIVLAVDPNARPDGTFWAPDPPEEGLGRFLRAHLPDSLGGLLPDGRDMVAPGYLDVVATSIDMMTATIKRMRLEEEPPDILLEAGLAHMPVLDFHRAGEAIAEGEAMVERAAERIRAVLASA